MESDLASLLALESACQPVHLPGLVSSWPAVADWSRDGGLAAALAGAAPPSTPLEVLVSSQGAADGAAYEVVTLGEFAGDSVSSRYLAQVPVDGGSPLAALRAGTPTPALVAPRAPAAVLWCSAGPRATSAHYDEYHGLLCVASGVKTVTVAPPGAPVAPRAPVGDAANHCAASDLSSVSGSAHFTLCPGDALFLPEGWWHAASSSARCAALTFWWRSPVVAGLAAAPAQAAYVARLACRWLAENEDSDDDNAPPAADASPAARALTAAARAPTPAAVLAALQAAATASQADAVANAAEELPPDVAAALARALDGAEPAALAALHESLGAAAGARVAAALLAGRQAAATARLARRLVRVLGSDVARAVAAEVG